MERLGFGGREMTAAGHSKDFVLRVVQPALIGLMDGSVSTLAPVFAVAVASGDARLTFLIGLAAAVGAAISMAFSEGLSDDGSLTGRGGPVLRGTITGVATFVGGIVHTLPFLMSEDRKSTRLNSSHANISYAVFCLKKQHTPTARIPYNS